MTNIEVIEGYGRENYGSFVLKKVYQKNVSTGLIIGITLHIAGIMTYYISTVVFKEEQIRMVRITDINELQSAPPLQEQTAAPKVKVEVQEVIKPVAGIPIVVPDAEAKPDMTIQTQEEIKTDIAAPTSFGSDGGEVKVDISGTIGDIGGGEPGMDEFVPVEQQPVIVAKVQPVYPELAKKAGLEGKVIVKALIDESGTVTKCVVLQGDEMFKESAVNALMSM
ncbi:MAG TPA: TonB family protein, partial [bacterium]|nr:TonB family protein [bacterium]